MPLPEASSGRAVVVLAGGTARRWGGRDKTALPLAGEPVLLHAVRSALHGARGLAVVAPADHEARGAVEHLVSAEGVPLAWTREDPAGSGPVAALAAGLAALPGPGTGIVAVLAGDLPLARTAWPRLLAALREDPAADAALGVDPDGRRQPLLGLYREGPLRERLAAVPHAGQPLRVVTGGLHVIDVPVTAAEALDLDTPEDAVEAERLLTAEGS